MKLNRQNEQALRDLIHAAFHILDDAEEISDGRWNIDMHFAEEWINVLGQALNTLDIESHEDIDAFMGSL